MRPLLGKLEISTLKTAWLGMNYYPQWSFSLVKDSTSNATLLTDQSDVP